MYKQIGGDAVIYCRDCWKITPKGDTRGWFYAAPAGAHGPEPPLGKWTTDGYDLGGADPPPIVAVVGPPIRPGDDEASGSPPFMALPVEPLPEPLPPPKKRSRRSTTLATVDSERGASHQQTNPIAGAPRRRSPEAPGPLNPGVFPTSAPVASPGGDGEQAPVDLGSVSSSPSQSPPAARGFARDPNANTSSLPALAASPPAATEASAKPLLAPAMASKNTLKDSPGAAAALKEKLNSLRRRAACRSDPPAPAVQTAEVTAPATVQTEGDGDAGAGAGIGSAPKDAGDPPAAAAALSGPPGVWDGPPIPAGGNAPATTGTPTPAWASGAASPWTYPPVGAFGARTPHTMKPGARLRGWVTHYYPHDQCGYLASHDLGYGVELYFECYNSWTRPLRHGDKVEFTPSRSPYGQPIAVNVSQQDANVESNSSGAGLPGLGWPSGDGNRSSRASSASPEPEPDGGASSPDSERPEPLDSANCQ